MFDKWENEMVYLKLNNNLGTILSFAIPKIFRPLVWFRHANSVLAKSGVNICGSSHPDTYFSM
jgi:hypothetical protein